MMGTRIIRVNGKSHGRPPVRWRARKIIAGITLAICVGAPALYAQNENVLDPASSFLTGFHRPVQSRRYWNLMERQSTPHVFGYYYSRPSMSAWSGEPEADDLGNLDFGLRAHRLRAGSLGISAYYNAYDGEGPHLQRFSGALSWADALEIGGQYLDVAWFGNGDDRTLWALEANLLRVSELFPNLSNVTVSLGGRSITLIDWEAMANMNLISLGDDGGDYSSIVYTGIPLVESVTYDRFESSGLGFVSPRVATALPLAPFSFTPTVEVSTRTLTQYEVSFDYLMFLTAMILGTNENIERANEVMRRMEKGLPIMLDNGQGPEEHMLVYNTVVSYTRDYYDPYRGLSTPHEISRLSGEFTAGAIVPGEDGLVHLSVGGGRETYMANDNSRWYWWWGIGVGLSSLDPFRQ